MPRRRPLQRLACMVLTLGTAVIGLSACGGSPSGGGASGGGGGGGGSGSGGGGGGHLVTKATGGRAIFQTAGCAGCHTLKAAGATGHVGPNLDSLQPSAETVRFQVEHGGGPMPAFAGKLTAAQISAVANFVASSAGQ